MITFYDVVAKVPIKTWSRNTWKTRLVLNYKQLPYKTVWLEYPDIEGQSVKYGIPPTGNWPSGRPLYTVPSILDNTTPVADSYTIAEYLDKMYPDTPKVIPPGTESLQAAFYSHLNKIMDPIWPFLIPALPSILNAGSTLEYYHRTRSELNEGKSVQDFALKGDEERAQAWGKVEAAFDILDGWLNKSSGPYFMGETITFADFAFLGYLYMIRDVLGETSAEWKTILKLNNGRFAAYIKSLERYSSTDK